MSQPKAPQYQPPSDDPAYTALKAQAQQDDINATQQRVQIDSASLLARYGSRLTLAAASGASPGVAAPPGGSSPFTQGSGGIIGTPGNLNAIFGRGT